MHSSPVLLLFLPFFLQLLLVVINTVACRFALAILALVMSSVASRSDGTRDPGSRCRLPFCGGMRCNHRSPLRSALLLRCGGGTRTGLLLGVVAGACCCRR